MSMVRLFNKSRNAYVMSLSGPQGTQYFGTLNPNQIMNVEDNLLGIQCFQRALAGGDVIQLAPDQAVPDVQPAPTMNDRVIQPMGGGDSSEIPTNEGVISAIGMEGRDAVPGGRQIANIPAVTRAQNEIVGKPASVPTMLIQPPTPTLQPAQTPAGGQMITAGQVKRPRGRPPKTGTPAVPIAIQASGQPVIMPQGVPIETPFGIAKGSLPVQPAMEPSKPPINPATGQPLYVEVNENMVPLQNQSGYLIQAAPSGIPGQGVMVPLDQLANEAIRDTLKQATNHLLASVAQGRQDSIAMQSWDMWNSVQKLQYVNSTNDKDILGRLIQREPSGQIALVLQQKINLLTAMESTMIAAASQQTAPQQ